MKSKDLTIRQFSALNKTRALHWHKAGLDSWSPAEWGNALAGEVGELCNVLKKLLRHDKGIQQLAVEEKMDLAPKPRIRAELVLAAAKEIADSYTYLDLVAARLGLDVQQCVVMKFNEISEREGLPQRFESRYETEG